MSDILSPTPTPPNHRHDQRIDTPVFGLNNLVSDALGWWLVAWLLGALTVLSAIGLLMVSGWFITLSAWAGLMAAGAHTFNYLAPAAVVRTLAIARTGGRYGELMTAHQAIFDILKSLRLRFFAQFAKLTPAARKNLDTSDSQYRMIKDIDILDEFVLKFLSPLILSAAALGLVLGVIGWLVSPWFWAFLLPVALLFGVVTLAGKPLATDERRLLHRRKQHFAWGLPAVTQLILWDRWQGWLADFDQHNQQASDFFVKSYHLKHLSVIIMQWLVGAMVLLVLWQSLGSNLPSVSHPHQVGLLLAVVLGVFGLAEILSTLVSEPLALGRAQTAKAHLNTLTITERPAAMHALPKHFDLQLIDLVTRQPDALFDLPKINQTIKQSVPLVISGVSGVGKSTLLDTIAKEIDPISGQIKLVTPEVGAPTAAKTDWHRYDTATELGYLGQQVDIFDQSLRDNLTLGKHDASDDALMQALKMVKLDDWVLQEPLGLDTPLGEYGTAVSGGQARRIALARLLLTPKKILLLDEPFAGLDAANRQALWQTLTAHQQDGILIVVSHHQLAGDYQHLIIGTDV